MKRAALTMPPEAACLFASLFGLMCSLKLGWQKRRTTQGERADYKFLLMFSHSTLAEDTTPLTGLHRDQRCSQMLPGSRSMQVVAGVAMMALTIGTSMVALLRENLLISWRETRWSMQSSALIDVGRQMDPIWCGQPGFSEVF